MKREPIGLAKLHEYCKKHEIIVPSVATRAEMEAAITRAAIHLAKVEPHLEIGCFGLWAHDDMTCRTCAFEEPCSDVSLGTSLDKHVAYVDRIENPRLNFTAPMRKGKGPLNRRKKNASLPE